MSHKLTFWPYTLSFYIAPDNRDKIINNINDNNFIFAVMILYGIPNCNTVKKARTWLAENGFNPEFHDFKKNGITAEKLNEWCTVFGWEKVLNKKGTTWKKLDAEVQNSVVDQSSAVQVLLKNNSAIKRPVVELDGKAVLISFDEEQYESVLK